MADDNGGGMVAGFLAGALLGAGVALMFAPMNGRRMRRGIRARLEDLGDHAGHQLERAKHTLEDGARQLGDAVREGREAAHGTAAAAIGEADRPR